MSEARKGKAPPNKGVPMSEDQRQKLSQIKKGNIWITNGVKDKLIKPEEYEVYEGIGFYKGRSIQNNTK